MTDHLTDKQAIDEIVQTLDHMRWAICDVADIANIIRQTGRHIDATLNPELGEPA